MFQVGYRVIRRKDEAKEIGTVISVIPDDRYSTEYSLYDVEFASGLQTLHGYELQAVAHSNLSCTERDMLSVTFQKAFEIYYQAVSELGKAAGVVAHTEFEFLRQRAKAKQSACDLDRERLQLHIAEHGC
jgi:hypothetical protein